MAVVKVIHSQGGRGQKGGKRGCGQGPVEEEGRAEVSSDDCVDRRQQRGSVPPYQFARMRKHVQLVNLNDLALYWLTRCGVYMGIGRCRWLLECLVLKH